MKDQDKSIQSKIIFLFVSFVLLVSLVYSVLLLGYSWVVEDNIFNRIVSEEAAFIKKTYDESQRLVEPRAPFLTLYSSWNQLPRDIYLQHLKAVDQVEFKTSDGISLYVQPINLEGKTAVLVADISKFEVGSDYLPIVFFSLLILLITITGLALITAYYLAKNAVKPLKDLTNKVQASDTITEGFSKEFPNNEIGILANTIEKSFAKVQSLLAREENFTRDVSHELRTPTTILKNLLTELKQDPELSQKQLSYLNENVNQIEQTIATLLTLAREETTRLKPLKFIEVLENSIVSHFELSKRESFKLKIDVSDSLVVLANKNLLQLLINNLISNALQYASSEHLSIKAQNNGDIVFENETNYEHQEDPFRSNVKRVSSKGLGLGLFLVQRVCQAFNWKVNSRVQANKFQLIIKTTGKSE